MALLPASCQLIMEFQGIFYIKNSLKRDTWVVLFYVIVN